MLVGLPIEVAEDRIEAPGPSWSLPEWWACARTLGKTLTFLAALRSDGITASGA